MSQETHREADAAAPPPIRRSLRALLAEYTSQRPVAPPGSTLWVYSVDTVHSAWKRLTVDDMLAESGIYRATEVVEAAGAVGSTYLVHPRIHFVHWVGRGGGHG